MFKTFPLAQRRGLLAAICLGALLHPAHAAVNPPPLPPGASMVKIEGGLDEGERKRQVRAHHHKFHHKKDYTRDDSVHGDAADEGGQGSGTEASVASATFSGALSAKRASAAQPATQCDEALLTGKRESKAVASLNDKAQAPGKKAVAGRDESKPLTACDIKKSIAGQQKKKAAGNIKPNQSKDLVSGSTQ